MWKYGVTVCRVLEQTRKGLCLSSYYDIVKRKGNNVNHVMYWWRLFSKGGLRLSKRNLQAGPTFKSCKLSHPKYQSQDFEIILTKVVQIEVQNPFKIDVYLSLA